MSMDSLNNNKKNPADWLESHGDYLFRFALSQLRDKTLAEDAVQDTLLAALQSYDKFAGDSSLRTWLTGILKNKIIDIMRKQSRDSSYIMSKVSTSETNDNLEDILFDERGAWIVPQNDWGNPDSALEQDRFWKAFMRCFDELPPKLARIFSLREFAGLQTSELCEILNITSSNSWVILYRARLALKECLESQWFIDSSREG
ncbi:MAG: sigma-70 family RNA polymerase sigma factor [Thioalkalispiraceae bacterium]|jgi:RNA polymerase sigma-70 factor (ECF subfamily)